MDPTAMLEKALAHMKARALRKLEISEVSSVDAGAGIGCKVLLTKRATTEESDEMAKDTAVCPHCGYSGGVDEFQKMAKRAQEDASIKATCEAIEKKYRVPADASDGERLALQRSRDVELSTLHRLEREHRGF